MLRASAWRLLLLLAVGLGMIVGSILDAESGDLAWQLAPLAVFGASGSRYSMSMVVLFARDPRLLIERETAAWRRALRRRRRPEVARILGLPLWFLPIGRDRLAAEIAARGGGDLIGDGDAAPGSQGRR